tara:strand:- start:30098 stop:33925 length:3828 start_codon:yes stop_codon:yes gene_type:complete
MDVMTLKTNGIRHRLGAGWRGTAIRCAVMALLAFVLGSQGASAFVGGGDTRYRSTPMIGSCNVTATTTEDSGITAAVFVDGLGSYGYAGGNYVTAGATPGISSGPAITLLYLANCLGTTEANIADFVQDGAQLPYADENFMGFSFRLLSTAGSMSAGFYTYYISEGTNTAPSLSFTDDVSASATTSDQITITTTDPDSGQLSIAKYGFSADATCNASDAPSIAFSSGVSFSITSESNNGNYICASIFDGITTTYQSSANALNIDLTAPVITPPATQTAPSDAGVSTATLDVTGLGSVTDNSGEVPAITYKVGTTVLTGNYAFPIGSTTVTMDATDSVGNVATQASFTVTVSDSAKPVANFIVSAGGFGCSPITVSFTDASTAGTTGVITNWLWDFGDGTTSTVQNPTHSFSNITATVRLTVTTALGATDTRTIASAVQALGPKVDFSADVTSGDAPLAVAFTSSTIGSAPLTGMAWAFGDGATSTSFSSATHTFTAPGSYTVSLTANDLDGCSGTETKSAFITVLDTEAPVLSAPTDQVANADAGLNTAALDVTALGSVSDNSGEVPAIIYKVGTTALSGSYDFPIGETTVTMDAADTSGNAATQVSFTVTVSDAEAPVITAPANIAQAADAGVSTASVSFTATVSDNSDTGLVPVFKIGSTVISSPYDFPSGVTTVTIDAEDSAGNAATQVSFTVTISDAEAPVITAPATQTLDTDAGLNTAAFDVTSLGSVTDNSGEVPAITYAIGATVLTGSYDFPIGDTMVTMDATDSAGNPAVQVSFLVAVTDVTAPEMPIIETTVVNFGASISISGSGEMGATATITFPDGSYQTVLLSSGTFDVTSPLGQPSGTVRVTVMDAAGNVSPAATVEVETDLIAPSLVISGATETAGFGDTTLLTFTFSEDVTGFAVSDISLSNATVASVTGGPAVYTALVTLTGTGDASASVPEGAAQDTAGNLSTASNRVTISDTTVADTQEQIATFLQSRATQLLANQPDLIPFLMGQNRGRFNAQVSRGTGHFDIASPAGQPVWMALTGSWSEQAGAETRYVFGALGSHATLSPNMMVGAMLQFDYADQTDGLARVTGQGWLTGPYVIARSPNHPLYFEGRALYGRSSNDISPYGTYTDQFDTKRWLLQAKLAGKMAYGPTTLRPNVDLSYTSDTQLSYQDGLGNIIPEQRFGLAQAALGLDFEHDVPLTNADLRINGGVSAIWSHSEGSGAASSLEPSSDGWRGRVDLGLSYAFDGGSNLALTGFYDGIGASDYESFGVGLAYSIAF